MIKMYTTLLQKSHLVKSGLEKYGKLALSDKLVQDEDESFDYFAYNIAAALVRLLTTW